MRGKETNTQALSKWLILESGEGILLSRFGREKKTIFRKLLQEGVTSKKRSYNILYMKTWLHNNHIGLYNMMHANIVGYRPYRPYNRYTPSRRKYMSYNRL